jgi:hypothetical protein
MVISVGRNLAEYPGVSRRSRNHARIAALAADQGTAMSQERRVFVVVLHHPVQTAGVEILGPSGVGRADRRLGLAGR